MICVLSLSLVVLGGCFEYVVCRKVTCIILYQLARCEFSAGVISKEGRCENVVYKYVEDVRLQPIA